MKKQKFKLWDAFPLKRTAIRAGKGVGVNYRVRKFKRPQDSGRLKYGVYLKDRRFV